jgi:hypothetical protein
MHGGFPPRHARAFVAVFLATLVFSALVPVNLWPFSNWELFSRLRTDRQIGWEGVAVDWVGHMRAYPLASLPQGYRGVAAVLADFSKRSAAERDAICADWLGRASKQLGLRMRLVRVYRLEWQLSDRQGNRPAPPHSTLAWVCSAKGAREAG